MELTPFRTHDPDLELATLREQRERLAAQVEEMRAELRLLRRWSWRQFFAGVCLFVVPAVFFLAKALSALR